MRAETTSGLVEERAKEKRGGERKRFADGGAQRSKLKIEDFILESVSDAKGSNT